MEDGVAAHGALGREDGDAQNVIVVREHRHDQDLRHECGLDAGRPDPPLHDLRQESEDGHEHEGHQDVREGGAPQVQSGVAAVVGLAELHRRRRQHRDRQRVRDLLDEEEHALGGRVHGRERDGQEHGREDAADLHDDDGGHAQHHQLRADPEQLTEDTPLEAAQGGAHIARAPMAEQERDDAEGERGREVDGTDRDDPEIRQAHRDGQHDAQRGLPDEEVVHLVEAAEAAQDLTVGREDQHAEDVGHSQSRKNPARRVQIGGHVLGMREREGEGERRGERHHHRDDEVERPARRRDPSHPLRIARSRGHGDEPGRGIPDPEILLEQRPHRDREHVDAVRVGSERVEHDGEERDIGDDRREPRRVGRDDGAPHPRLARGRSRGWRRAVPEVRSHGLARPHPNDPDASIWSRNISRSGVRCTSRQRGSFSRMSRNRSRDPGSKMP